MDADTGTSAHLPEEFVIRELLDASDLDALEREHGAAWADSGAVLRFRHLRTAARYWLAAALGDERAALSAPIADGWEAFTSVEWGAVHMRDAVNSELKAFSMRLVEVDGHGALEPQFSVDLLQVAALQLALLAADGLNARRCANETCGRGFVRQRSTRRKTTNRGEYAGTAHAVGVRYCSAECGKAQQAREHRRRKRVEKGDSA
ncbi:hypothetical protein [Microbacterium testaceum]|uniref:hypothetical protein n=1 Tax=Microbacterium testaceum TaxID=2033 RepID=UPI000734BE10|nr:hypothetical protein [Microbacterium testaceum]